MARSTSPYDLTGHCPRCLLREQICICPITPQVPTCTRITILRHTREEQSTSNTARIAALALPNCELVPCGQGLPLADALFNAPDTWLLWPEGGRLPSEDFRPQRLLVLDGSWRQARKLLHKERRLLTLPRLSLLCPATPKRRLRRPTRPDGMSTLEAIAAALRQLEGEAVGAPLDLLHDELVRRSISLRGF